jgi:hypothetical protein
VTTFVLGAGASVDAGYPLARELGLALQEWIKLGKLPSPDYEAHIDQLSELYGGGAQVAPSSDADRPAIFDSREFEFLGYPSEVSDPLCQGISSTAGRPALILPTLHKRFSVQTSLGRVWEPFWRRLWKQAECALACSKEVVLIGYSMTTADEKARELLLHVTSRDAVISVFCGGDSARIHDEFRTHGFRCVKTPGHGYLSNYLNI